MNQSFYECRHRHSRNIHPISNIQLSINSMIGDKIRFFYIDFLNGNNMLSLQHQPRLLVGNFTNSVRKENTRRAVYKSISEKSCGVIPVQWD